MNAGSTVISDSHSFNVSVDGGDLTVMEQLLENSEVKSANLDEGTLTDAAKKGALWMQIKHTDSVSSRPVRIRDLDVRAERSALVLLNINTSVLSEKPKSPVMKREEKNYSIWYKPAGMLCQGTRWADHCSLARVIEQTIERPVHLVHRLDKAASGLIVGAHTRPAAKALSTLFADRQVNKIYQATVFGSVKWTLPHVIDNPVDGKKAKTIVLSAEATAAATVDDDQKTTRLTVQIETGRKHQIRQHLSKAGFPIVGDRLFDSSREHDKDLQLVATELSFVCPFSGQQILVSGD